MKTHHAVERLKERGGIVKSAIDVTIERALKSMPGAETAGRFRRYIDRQGIMHHSSIYVGDNDLLFAVKDNTVITVMTTPLEHRKQARIQLAKWKAQKHD